MVDKKTDLLTKPFPTTGFQITTELSSLEIYHATNKNNQFEREQIR